MDLILILVGATVVGFGVMALATLGRSRGPTPYQKRLEARFHDLNFRQFERFCTEIVEGLKLEILQRQVEGDGEFSLQVQNPQPIVGGHILVHCLFIPETQEVAGPRVMELSDNVIAGRLSKGIFITTGRFAPEVNRLQELAPMELIDGEALKDLAEKFRIPL